MRILKLVILLISTLNSMSQTKLDSLVMERVNDYRTSNGIPSTKFSIINFNASNHHSNYLINSDIISHNEENLKHPIDRFSFFGGKCTQIGENISSLSFNTKIDSINYQEISNKIVNFWIKSQPHNEILLNKDFKFSGVSCVQSYKKSGIKDFTNIKIVSTLVLSN